MPCNAINNGIADLVADHGLMIQGWDSIQKAFDFLARRQDAYAKFVARIVKMLAKLLRQDLEKREVAEKQSEGATKAVLTIKAPIHSPRPLLHEGQLLEFLNIAPGIRNINDELLLYWQCA